MHLHYWEINHKKREKNMLSKYGKENESNISVLITTQYRENYAAHNDDYEHGVDEPYWKFKGGSQYIIENVNLYDTEGPTFDQIIKMVEPITTYSNGASEEYVIANEIFDDTESLKLSLTEWESPTYIEITDTGFTISKFVNNEGEYGYMNHNIKSLQKVWYHDKTGKVTKYLPTYTMNDGSLHSSDESVRKWLEAA